MAEEANTQEETQEESKTNNEEENFDAVFEDEEAHSSSLNDLEETRADLKTHGKIKSQLSGNLIELDKGYSKTTLQTTKEMLVDEFGLVHSGFIYSGADYAAATAVNEENVVIIGAKSKFLAPAKMGDLITFEGKAKFEDSRKREIKVIGKINEIKVYEGIFHAVVLDQHILRTKIRSLGKSR